MSNGLLKLQIRNQRINNLNLNWCWQDFEIKMNTKPLFFIKTVNYVRVRKYQENSYRFCTTIVELLRELNRTKIILTILKNIKMIIWWYLYYPALPTCVIQFSRPICVEKLKPWADGAIDKFSSNELRKDGKAIVSDWSVIWKKDNADSDIIFENDHKKHLAFVMS